MFYAQLVLAAEELVVVQTVSTDQKSFVIAKGLKDGISKGQELIFANDNISLVCKAIEVNHNYSYWYPINENVTVPFLREEIVSTNSHFYGSIGLGLVADENKLIETFESKKEFDRFRTSNHFSLRGSMGAGLAQSTSSVSTDQNPKGYAYDVSLEYDVRLQPEFEIGFGMRRDSDIYRLSTTALDIPTTRLMAVAVATYHFVNWSNSKNNLYISLLGGFGTSKTVVSETTNSGTAAIIPQVRLGYIMPFSKQSAMLFEVSVESTSAKETLPDSTVQKSSYTNAKATIGITF